jgi:mRNA interferase HigB
MKVSGKDKLEAFRRKHADVRSQIDAWIAEAEAADWKKPHDVLARYASASVVGKDRIVFNLKGNRYRLDVKISYQLGVLTVIRLGTHAEYDSWSF